MPKEAISLVVLPLYLHTVPFQPCAGEGGTTPRRPELPPHPTD